MENKYPISISAARLAIAAIVTYHAILFALIPLRPDLDPYWHTISEWAIGPYGWMMSAGFIIAGISYVSLFVSLCRQIHGIGGKIGLVLLAICIVGLIGVGSFTTDPMDDPTRPLTTTGLIHMITGMSQLFLLPFAALLINLNLARKNPAWAPARKALLLTAGVPLLGLIGFIVYLNLFVIPLGQYAHGSCVPIGWPPRFLFLSYALWVIMVAVQAIRAARPASHQTHNFIPQTTN